MISVSAIQTEVCRHYRVGRAELLSDRRFRYIARPRQIAMYLAKELTPQSLPRIGRQFHRDHTTVIHAIKAVEALRLSDEEADRFISRVIGEQRLNEMAPAGEAAA